MTTVDHVAVRPSGPAAHPDGCPAAAPGTPGHRTGGAVGTVGAATSLLDAYEPGRARFFASPTRTLLAHGERARVPHGDTPLARRVTETLDAQRLAGHRTPLVVGTVPFDPTAPAELAVPEAVRWAPALADDPLIALHAAARWDIRPVPGPAAYGAAVAEAVRRMKRGDFAKVVLARTLELRSDRELDLPALLQRLARRDPGGYTFAVPSGPGRTLLGASPDLAEDVRRAAALLQSEKDLHEHSVVVDAVRDALAPYCRTLDVPLRPTLVRTAAMWHLSTTIGGELADPAVSALELAAALHPTPAVCGTPTRTAREVIGELEPFDRGHFTGMVGWGDANGDGEWVVTIRCAEAEERTLRLYAGAGVADRSSPEAETAETGAKFRTFLDAVGANHQEAAR
ncbi:chorismate-binding protein [Streptomyces sp. NPDC051173]|uniref:chorismate-binding protein n=1 Tax=Streptomyces sp. NPDC051173 TaxID=3155164 RepID=UPI00344F4F5B